MITPQQAQDMLHYESTDGFTAPELCLTAELAAHAPVMAEQIANMRYEYAVVCLVEGDVWRYARGGVLITPLEHEARWFPTREEAEAYAERRRSTAKETRVVPRLVSTPEVAE